MRILQRLKPVNNKLEQDPVVILKDAYLQPVSEFEHSE